MPPTNRDFWNGRFAGEPYIFGTRPAAFVKDNAHYIPPRSRVLVPADGEGRNSVYLAELGHRVVATDIAKAGFTAAAQRWAPKVTRSSSSCSKGSTIPPSIPAPSRASFEG
jgi:hypothetical protein